MKRIAIFLDGTWNTLNNNTNVWRLKSLCAPDEPQQLVYYSQGVGIRFGEKVRGGVEGYGLDIEIIDAYTWLVQVFETGDEIFVFGFSRGAYAARSVSGLISKCGVLKPGAPLSIEQLYARYRRRTDRTIRQLQAGGPSSYAKLEERWIAGYCIPTNIKFVGVWDTVGSLGNPLTSLRRNVIRYLFLDTHLYHSNEFAFHALALDEHRRQFEPTFWTRTVDNDAAQDAHSRMLEQVEQRWFVGAHANVGGGYPSDVLAQAPLKWLMDKAAAHGLRFRSDFKVDPADPTAPVADSYTSFGPALLRLFSKRFYRPVGAEPTVGTKRTTSRINETIDASVFERWRSNPAYRPPNLQAWAERFKLDPASLTEAVLASNPEVVVAHPQPAVPPSGSGT
jgi:uncharacterized protein (DUF2235 family)